MSHMTNHPIVSRAYPFGFRHFVNNYMMDFIQYKADGNKKVIKSFMQPIAKGEMRNKRPAYHLFLPLQSENGN